MELLLQLRAVQVTTHTATQASLLVRNGVAGYEKGVHRPVCMHVCVPACVRVCACVCACEQVCVLLLAGVDASWACSRARVHVCVLHV